MFNLKQRGGSEAGPDGSISTGNSLSPGTVLFFFFFHQTFTESTDVQIMLDFSSDLHRVSHILHLCQRGQTSMELVPIVN